MRTSGLPSFSIKRPITTLMIFTSFILLGIVTYFRLPIQLLPDGFDPPFMFIQIPYMNSSPSEIEQKITKPVEETLRTVKNIDVVSSTSGSDYVFIFLQFKQNTDMHLAYSEVKDRMERVKATLPSDVEKIFIRRASPNDESILDTGVQFKIKPDDVYYYIEHNIAKKIERLPGVARVEIFGTLEKDIEVLFSMDRVKAHHIDLYTLTERLRNDNFSLSSGRIIESGKVYTVRSVGKYGSIEEVSTLPLPGTNLLLKDIAVIRYGEPKRERIYRINGKEAFAVDIYKESQANTVKVVGEIKKNLDEIEREDPNIIFLPLDDAGHYITESIDLLRNNGFLGGVLAVALLFYFLRRIRLTLMITFAIPVSLLMTLVFMLFFHQSLNIISMMGLMLTIGMLVDNSVVVVENIDRLNKEGLQPTAASIKGTSEVTLAIVMSTLTTIVVFLPSTLMVSDGMLRFFMLTLAIPIMVSLLASLFVSLIFVPLASSIILKDHKEPKGFFRWMDNIYEKTLGACNRIYGKILSETLSHRLSLVLIVFLIFLLTLFFPMSHVKMDENAEGSGREVHIFLDLPDSYTLAQADIFIKRVEKRLDEVKDSLDLRMYRFSFNKSWGDARVFLKSEKESRFTTPETVEKLSKIIPKAPGVHTYVNWKSGQEGANEYKFFLYGDDSDILLKIAEEMKRRVALLPSVISVDTDMEQGSDEIYIKVNRESAERFGVSPAIIASIISYAVRGYPLPKYHMGTKEVDMKVQVREEDRETLSQLMDISIPVRNNRSIPLSAISTFSIEKSMGQIERRNGKMGIGLKVSVSDKNKEKGLKEVKDVLRGFAFPKGVIWEEGDWWGRQEEMFKDFQLGMILSIAFVFLLMGVLFESFMLPLSVITSIPLSIFGAYWLLYITGEKLNIMAIIGMIFLVGLVVNNAIVLIDRVNQLRIDGVNRRDAIVTAATQRFRPILMTAFTTILGLLPMAFGRSSFVGIPYAPMGQVFVGGLFSGTMLTLIVVPVSYTLFDDLRIYLFRETRSLIYVFEKKGGRIEKQDNFPV